MTELILSGCRPQPLAHYLKALGLLRAIVEQGADPDARASWRGDAFVVRSALDAQGLRQFLLERWSPTPILAPWNGGSGFYPKDNQDAITALRASPAERLAPYRASIEAASALLKRLGLTDKPEKAEKERLLVQLRNHLPDPAIRWLDTAVLLTRDKTSFPPLTGSGGNDGRLEFSRNFMDRVVELIDPQTGAPMPGVERLLEGALTGAPVAGLSRASGGQFLPGADGINPWDFVFMIEGALIFTAAATRRMEQSGPGELVYPFMVRPSGVGYGSASPVDEAASRAELWAPLWGAEASLGELKFLFGEGRARVGRRNARDGVDFARALMGLGVARGLTGFVRYAFQERNGLAYIATPLGRFTVRDRPQTDLLGPLDWWLDAFERVARGDTAPASIKRAHRALQAAILELAGGGEWTDVLISLGAVEAALDRSRRFVTKSKLQPIPWLSARWRAACSRERGGVPELRLARALAARGLRHRLVRGRLEGGRFRWAPETDRASTWTRADLTTNLLGVLLRETLETSRGLDVSKAAAPGETLAAELRDVGAFIDRELSDELLESLLRGLSLIRPPRPAPPGAELPRVAPQLRPIPLPYPYGLLALVRARHLSPGVEVPLAPEVIRLAAAGQPRALSAAHRRLVGAGLHPLLGPDAALPLKDLRRIAAATAFPLSPRALARVAGAVLHLDTD